MEQRLAAGGLRLLATLCRAYWHRPGRQRRKRRVRPNDTWQSSNVGLTRRRRAADPWALIILPKRERQFSGEASTEEEQSESFETRAHPAGARSLTWHAEKRLLEDYGKLLGGKARLQFPLPSCRGWASSSAKQGDP